MVVDEDKVIKAVHSLNMTGNEEGLLFTFGVYLTNMYTDYYNALSFDFESEVIKSAGEEMEEVVAGLLIHAAQDCANNTLGGIWMSQEWASVVEPMVECKEDIIYGITAITNALGWGNWEVVEIVPFERLVMRAYTPYEGPGYVDKYGKAKSGKCYMLAGVAGGLMDLVYPEGSENKTWQEIKPTGTPDLVARIEKFIAKEVKCIAKGDPHCEFIATTWEKQ